MDEKDYVSILAGLGRECLGAIKIVDESDEVIHPEYRELSAEEVYALASGGATELAELVTKSHLSLTGALSWEIIMRLEMVDVFFVTVDNTVITDMARL